MCARCGGGEVEGCFNDCFASSSESFDALMASSLRLESSASTFILSVSFSSAPLEDPFALAPSAKICNNIISHSDLHTEFSLYTPHPTFCFRWVAHNIHDCSKHSY